MRHVVVIGADGQLGTDLMSALVGFRTTGLVLADLDVRDPRRARSVLQDLRPEVVINTAAFHRVDLCEDEPEMSFAVNATGAYNLALIAADLDLTVVHFSTDYVFDGRAQTPYAEEALPNPLSVYGTSKLAGEFLVRNFCPRHYVIRTTGLFGVAGALGKGGNFVETMIRLGRSGNSVRVVDDQVLTPTATADLATAITTLLKREKHNTVPYGLYHVTSAGHCSWFEFAEKIFELCGIDVDLAPISTDESGNKARRPPYSVLSHTRWISAGLSELRPWPEALTDYLKAKGHLPG
jgi:dTDP-4-dehydrorhamnose reductase